MTMTSPIAALVELETTAEERAIWKPVAQSCVERHSDSNGQFGFLLRLIHDADLLSTLTAPGEMETSPEEIAEFRREVSCFSEADTLRITGEALVRDIDRLSAQLAEAGAAVEEAKFDRAVSMGKVRVVEARVSFLEAALTEARRHALDARVNLDAGLSSNASLALFMAQNGIDAALRREPPASGGTT